MGEARVAIVGSGFGGLAAGIRLQAAGVETVMYEARDRPGAAPTSTKIRASPSTQVRPSSPHHIAWRSCSRSRVSGWPIT